MNEPIDSITYVGPCVLPLATFAYLEVLGKAFMLGQLTALIAGEHKDSVPMLYSLSHSSYVLKKPLIGPPN